MHKWHVNSALGRGRPLRSSGTSILFSRYFTSTSRVAAESYDGDKPAPRPASRKRQDTIRELENLYENSQLSGSRRKPPNSAPSTRPLAPSDNVRSATWQPNIPGALDVRKPAAKPPISNSESPSLPQRVKDSPFITSDLTSVRAERPSDVNAPHLSYRDRNEDGGSQFGAKAGRDPHQRSGTHNRHQDLEGVHPAVANLSASKNILDSERSASELDINGEDAEALIPSTLEEADDSISSGNSPTQEPTALEYVQSKNTQRKTTFQSRSPTTSSNPRSTRSSLIPSISELGLSNDSSPEILEDEIPDPPLPAFEPTAPTLESLSSHSPALALDRFSMSATITQRMEALTHQSVIDKYEVDRLASRWLEGERVLFAGGRMQKEAVVREVERRLRDEGNRSVGMIEDGSGGKMASEEEKEKVVDGLVGGRYRIGKGKGVTGGAEMLAERNGSYLVGDGERLMEKINELISGGRRSITGKQEQGPRT